jgi:cell division transport system ATP-binding protein
MKTKQANKPIIEIVRATKIYPPDVVALEDITLSVPYGEMLFLTGMSGAGKTTLLKLICGMENPDKGLIEVAGQDLNRIKAKEIPRLRQQIGMAYQDFKLLADRTVAQNISMAMEVAYHNISSIKNRVIELLQKLRLEHKYDALAGRLSRGEQQRVAIARVMELFEDCNSSGTTVIIATHDGDIYRETDYRVLELHSGRFLVQEDMTTSASNNMP